MPKAKRQRPEPAKKSMTRRRTIQWSVGVVAALVVAAVVAYFAYQSAADLPGVSFADQGNLHVQTLAEAIPPYNSDPPTSGPHLPYVAPWGVHSEPVPKQLQVHNLEDGGVVIQYNCPNGCPELVDKLKAVVQRYDRQVLLAPYPGMQRRIALTAWTRMDAFDEFDESRIVKFISRYRGIDHHKR
jgi:hypothetical protein